MKIILVRHGQTDWNVNHILQGKTNIDLNSTGKKQALEVKEKLKDIHFDVCFSSPLKRAYETASIITDTLIIADDRIIERDLGLLEGKKNDLYNAQLYWNYNLNSNKDNVESVQEILKRTEQFIDYLKKEYYDKTILIVSHGGTIRALHHVINGYNENTNFLEIKIPNCCIFEYTI